MTFAATLAPFLDPVAFAIVGGGTLAATILRTPSRDVARGLIALKCLARAPFDAGALVNQVEALTRISARHGVMQLDRSVIRDADVGVAVAAIVDGAEADKLRIMIDEARTARHERQRAAADMWAGAAELAPAMGMIGTLIGLVRLFTTMSDPAVIGASMAIAVLATLYGALLGNLVCLPIATRLKRLARAEYIERGRLAAPLAALAARETPRWREEAA